MSCGFGKALGVVLLAFPFAACAAFFLSSEGRGPLLNEELSYRDDPSPASSLEEVLTDSGGWVSQKSRPFRSNGEPLHIWVKIEVPTVTVSQRVLISTGAWESAEYFIVRDGQLVDRQAVGTFVPLAEQKTRVTMTPTSFYAGFVAVDLLPQVRTTVFVRLATENRIRAINVLLFALWDESRVRNGELRDRFFQGIFWGVMLIAAMLCLARFSGKEREPIHLYFVSFILACAHVWGVLYGLQREFLWPDRPTWDFYSMWIAIPLGLWSFIQFGRRYLAIDQYAPALDAALKWVAYAALALLPAYFLPIVANRPMNLRLNVIGAMLSSSLTIALIAATTILALLKRQPFAPLFSVALLCYTVGASIFFAMTLGAIPEIEVTCNAGQLGTALMTVLLTIGLESRTRQPKVGIAKHIPTSASCG